MYVCVFVCLRVCVCECKCVCVCVCVCVFTYLRVSLWTLAYVSMLLYDYMKIDLKKKKVDKRDKEMQWL